MKYKAVIFDSAGTLLDSLGDIAGSMNHVLEEHDFPIHHVDTDRYFVGGGAVKLVSRALPEKLRHGTLASESLDIYKRTYKANWKKTTRS